MASPTQQLRARLQFLRNQTKNLRPAVRAVHKEFITDRKRDFSTNGTTTQHGAWQANAASTIRSKGHARVLRGRPSGGFQLQKSIVNSRHNDHIFRWQSPTSGARGFLEIGTKHWKARIHHLGISKNAPGVKRRPIDPTNKQRRGYATIISNWIFKGKLP